MRVERMIRDAAADTQTAREQHIAYRILVELLAHQFAYPVQWIETQKELYSRDDPIRRFIELGPSKVLTGMAKRTGAASFNTRDKSLLIERQFLSTSNDTKEIQYDYDQPHLETDQTILDSGEKADAELEVSRTLTQQPAAAPSPQLAAAPSIVDIPLTALQIIQALIAQKLRKGVEQVPINRSIKDLSGGKSTQQNELLGDLGNEFGNLQDGSEDVPLKSLAESVEGNFSGQLGKQSSKLVSRMISAKMPAGFNQIAVREHLERAWGLGPSRQAAVLLLAMTEEPAVRLPSADAARKYMDSQISRYGALSGLILQPVQTSKAASGITTMVDSEQIKALRKEQHTLQMKQLGVLAQHLGIDTFQNPEHSKLQLLQEESQERLDLWNSEFSEDFGEGISPLFNPLKGRCYDSWWNLVRQDTIALYHQIRTHNFEDTCEKRDALIRNVSNRASEEVRLLIREMTSLDLGEDNKKNFSSIIGRELNIAVEEGFHVNPVFKFNHAALAPKTTISEDGRVQYSEVDRFELDCKPSYVELLTRESILKGGEKMPLVSIKRKQGAEWILDTLMTNTFINTLSLGAENGLSFAGKDVLVTGAGPGSIGAEVVRGLLMGGARVIVTTSRALSDNASYFQGLYENHGARGSELLVLPFNQGSKADCEALIDHIFSDSGLGRSLDAIIPFAAVSEVGIEIDSIGSKSELAHRLMLVNVLRLLGCVVKCKRERQIRCRPTQVLIPLSPNHGTFGGDGLYAESKLGLEALLNRFRSENWSEFLLITGAVIGWTRGTGLMDANDIVAEAVESHGALTFSREEMAFNILGLMYSPMVVLGLTQPLWADLHGGLNLLPDLKKILVDWRSEITLSAEIRRAIKEEDNKQKLLLENATPEKSMTSVDNDHKLRSTLQIGFPDLPDFDESVKPLQDLQGMVDPSRTIVIVGMSELGPWGSTRTRWEMEANGKFTQEGYIEMAWMMNMIKHFDGEQKGHYYVGWVDAVTGEQVHDSEIPAKYGPSILQHSGIRIIDDDSSNGYDPSRREFLHEVAIEEDLPEFDCTLASAEAFKLQHGDKVSIRKVGNDDEYKVRIKAGSHIMVPKSISSDSIVAGQIPKGWNATKYGVPEDLMPQIDPVTLFVLCCACECLYSAGIVDSLELFKYMHPAELGNFIGTAMGGTTKTRQMYKDRYLDKSVQGDIIQETYLNTSAAWLNMLLLGSTGPIKTPTGTCATGVESIDSACESILAGKTKFCFTGGVDDFQEDEAYGFATMKATVNTTKEFAKGRLPREMSRPMTKSRAGFVESQGCGMHLLATAELALAMGLPIYGIVAGSTMAGDKIGRSVPAPGQGVLTFARESPSAAFSPLLDIKYRREQLASIHERISANRFSELAKLRASTLNAPNSTLPGTNERAIAAIDARVESQWRDAQNAWGNSFQKQDPEISPLRAALAVWGLKIDDLDIISMHGTSTQANDKNEADVVNKQMRHLGRTPGRPLLAVCQKSLTGHPKAPAASWMLNGCLQILQSGIVPGNRNADNVDEELRKCEHLVFPNKSIQTSGIRAFLLDSFGFGQKGGQVIGVAPQYFFATLTRAAFEEYASKVSARKANAGRAYSHALMTNTLFQAKTSPAYLAPMESRIFLDPSARVSADSDGEGLFFDGDNLHRLSHPASSLEGFRNGGELLTVGGPDNSNAGNELKEWMESAIEEVTVNAREKKVTVGIDTEEIGGSFNTENEVFIDRNFTLAEQVQANNSADPRSTFAGKWSAKEAVFKSFGIRSRGAGAPMKDIEILKHQEVPIAVLHGEALAAANAQGIESIKLSISHSAERVVAVALAIRKESVRGE